MEAVKQFKYTLKCKFAFGRSIFCLNGRANANAKVNKQKNIRKFITHEFKLKDINKAIKLFRTGTAGRIIIKTNDDI